MSNIKIMKVLSLINNINFGQIKYNPSEIFINFDKSEYDIDNNQKIIIEVSSPQ